MSIDVSIIIVSWNTRELLEQCLRSIDADAGDVCVETFVVDNASTDDSPDMVEQNFPHVHVIRNDHNVGFANANNQAIRESSGRYVLLLNPDTIILDSAIEKTIAFMDAQPKSGIATCKLLNADRTFQICFGDAFPSLRSMMTGGSSVRTALSSLVMSKKYLASSGIQQCDIDEAHPVVWVMGAYMMIRREVINDVGMLDENLFMYGEEADLCYRATRAGWEMWYTPTGETIHLGGQSTKQIDLKKSTGWGLTTSYYFFRKHGGALHVLCCFIAGIILSLIKCVVYGLLNLLPASGEKKNRRRDKLARVWHTLGWHFTHNPFKLMRKPGAP